MKEGLIQMFFFCFGVWFRWKRGAVVEEHGGGGGGDVGCQPPGEDPSRIGYSNLKNKA